jgi:hypothetical protein
LASYSLLLYFLLNHFKTKIMSKKNLTKGQRRVVSELVHNEGLTRNQAVDKAIQDKGPDQPTPGKGWYGLSAGFNLNGDDEWSDYADTEDDV